MRVSKRWASLLVVGLLYAGQADGQISEEYGPFERIWNSCPRNGFGCVRLEMSHGPFGISGRIFNNSGYNGTNADFVLTGLSFDRAAKRKYECRSYPNCNLIPWSFSTEDWQTGEMFWDVYMTGARIGDPDVWGDNRNGTATTFTLLGDGIQSSCARTRVSGVWVTPACGFFDEMVGADPARHWVYLAAYDLNAAAWGFPATYGGRIRLTTVHGLTAGQAVSYSVGTAQHVTPEPTSMILLGTGLAGLAGAARRRRRKEA